MRKFRALSVAVLVLGGCASAPSSSRVDLLDGLERRTLPNGLAVLVKENHRLPRVTVMVAYRVGSVNEEPGITGVSHFFEHMVFKGTKRHPRGDIDRVTYRCGGENNAFTMHDMTGYWFHVGAGHAEEVLDILADTMGNCTLDAKEFESEKNTVLQEMNIWLDGPWGKLERDVEKNVYEESRYRHPVLGWREDVEKLTPETMRAYYKEHYTPNHASVLILGDVKKEEAFQLVEKHFGGIPRGPEGAPPRAVEPPQAREKSVELQTDKAADRLIMAFRTDRAGSDEDIALDVMAALMGEGRTSRLSRRLVDQESLAGEGNVEANNYSRRYEGLFTIRAELALEASAEKARAVVIEELEALKNAPVLSRELQRAKNILKARFAFDAESQYEMAQKIGYFEALGLPDYVRQYMGRVEAVTPEQIQSWARKVFAAQNRTVGLGRAAAKRAPARSPRPGRRRNKRHGDFCYGAAPDFGEQWEVKLPNGLTVLVKPASDVPVVTMRAWVDAGPLHDPPGKSGLASLVGGMLDEGVDDGAGRRGSADEIASRIEFVGGKLETGPQGVVVKVLSEHAALGFDLLRDLLRFPSFPEERFVQLKNDALAEIATLDDDPGDLARRLFYEEAYKGHPLERPASGAPETLESIARKDVVEHYRKFFRPENTILAIAGDVDPSRTIAEVRARFGAWLGEGEGENSPIPEALKQGKRKTRFHSYASRQARIMIGHVGIDRTDPDYPALRVMETILCDSPGFTNRLARVVRDEQGLAYDIHGTITGGADRVAGPFVVSLGVEARDKDKAIDLVMQELGRFVEEGPTEKEVEDAKRYLLANFVSQWETTEDLAGYLIHAKRFHLGSDYADRFCRAVSKTTREEIRRVAEEHLDLRNYTLVVVGPVDEEGNLIEKEDR